MYVCNYLFLVGKYTVKIATYANQSQHKGTLINSKYNYH